MEINSQLRTWKCGRLIEDHLGPLSTVSNFDINSLRFLSFFEKPPRRRPTCNRSSFSARCHNCDFSDTADSHNWLMRRKSSLPTHVTAKCVCSKQRALCIAWNSKLRSGEEKIDEIGIACDKVADEGGLMMLVERLSKLMQESLEKLKF